MFLFLFAFTLVATVVILANTPKVPDAGSTSLQDLNIPKAEEGAAIPRVYGTCLIESPNTVWYGDLYKEDIRA